MRFIRTALRYIAIIAAVALFAYVAGYTSHKLGNMPQGRLPAPELPSHGEDAHAPAAGHDADAGHAMDTHEDVDVQVHAGESRVVDAAVVEAEESVVLQPEPEPGHAPEAVTVTEEEIAVVAEVETPVEAEVETEEALLEGEAVQEEDIEAVVEETVVQPVAETESVTVTEAPAELTLTVPQGASATKAPVAFSHTAHEALDCTGCHHTWDGTSAIQSCAADGCHHDLADKRGPNSFYKAFHAMQAENSCLGCHRALKQAGDPAGPVSCTDCHPK